MATRGRPIPAEKMMRLRKLCLFFRVPVKVAARQEDVAPNTVRKYVPRSERESAAKSVL